MKTKQIPTLQLESTGDESFDAILGGGLPAQSVVVIAGEPGSGKTVLTFQILFRAAREGKKCLYFTTLAEPAIKSSDTCSSSISLMPRYSISRS